MSEQGAGEISPRIVIPCVPEDPTSRSSSWSARKSRRKHSRPSVCSVDLGHPFIPSPSARAVSTPPADEASQTAIEPHAWVGEIWRKLSPPVSVSRLVHLGRAAYRASMTLVQKLDKSFGIAPPIHFSQTQIERVESFAQQTGWGGPVLWYIPENVTLEDLVELRQLDPHWWSAEPNFPRNIPTVSPYDDSGYWILWVPLPHPATRGCCLQEQVGMLPRIAHALGFRRADIVLGDATDLAFMMAVGQHLNVLEPPQPFAVRTETCLHLSARSRSAFEHLDALNVSLIVSNSTVQLGDYPNSARAPFLGVAPLLY